MRCPAKQAKSCSLYLPSYTRSAPDRLKTGAYDRRSRCESTPSVNSGSSELSATTPTAVDNASEPARSVPQHSRQKDPPTESRRAARSSRGPTAARPHASPFFRNPASTSAQLRSAGITVSRVKRDRAQHRRLGGWRMRTIVVRLDVSSLPPVSEALASGDRSQLSASSATFQKLHTLRKRGDLVNPRAQAAFAAMNPRRRPDRCGDRRRFFLHPRDILKPATRDQNADPFDRSSLAARDRSDIRMATADVADDVRSRCVGVCSRRVRLGRPQTHLERLERQSESAPRTGTHCPEYPTCSRTVARADPASLCPVLPRIGSSLPSPNLVFFSSLAHRPRPLAHYTSLRPLALRRPECFADPQDSRIENLFWRRWHVEQRQGTLMHSPALQSGHSDMYGLQSSVEAHERRKATEDLEAFLRTTLQQAQVRARTSGGV